MVDVVVTVSGTQLGPIFVFVIITMFCIIGNVVKGFEMDMGVVSPYLDLWALGTCTTDSTTGLKACARIKFSDVSTLFGGSCDGAVHHIRAAAAFGIITSILSGTSLFLACVFFLRNNITSPKAFGIVLSALNVVFTVIAFVLYISVREAECLDKLDLKVHAGAFMYLAAFLFSMLNVLLYALQDAPRGSASSNNNNNYGNNSPQQQQPQQPRNNEPRPTGRPNNNNRPPQQQSAGSPTKGGSSPQQQQQASPPPASNQRSLPPTTVSSSPPPPSQNNNNNNSNQGGQEELWPDGNDWVVDPSSDLLWSEEKHLFFDRQSGQFFDPKSDQWYDPEGNRWYKIQ